MAMLLTLKYRFIHSYVVVSCGTQEVVSQSQVIHMSGIPSCLKIGNLRYPNILKGINMLEIIPNEHNSTEL